MIALASLLHLSLLLLPHHVIVATSHIVRLSGSDGQKVLESRGAATETHPTGVGSSLSRGSCTGDPAAEERNHTLVEPPYSRPCVTSATHTHTNTHPCTSPPDRSVHGFVGLAHKHRRSPQPTEEIAHHSSCGCFFVPSSGSIILPSLLRPSHGRGQHTRVQLLKGWVVRWKGFSCCDLAVTTKTKRTMTFFFCCCCFSTASESLGIMTIGQQCNVSEWTGWCVRKGDLWGVSIKSKTNTKTLKKKEFMKNATNQKPFLMFNMFLLVCLKLFPLL